MATVIVRKLDANGDPMYGHGDADFISDIDAVAQIILTKLRLFQGEWWENLAEGTPMFQSILGVPGAGKHPQTISLILKTRIEQVDWVTGVSDITTSYDATSRAFAFTATVQTIFGPLTISNVPGALPAQNLL
jgi:hypothetical protein